MPKVTANDFGRQSRAKLYALYVLVHEAIAENCCEAFKREERETPKRGGGALLVLTASLAAAVASSGSVLFHGGRQPTRLQRRPVASLAAVTGGFFDGSGVLFRGRSRSVECSASSFVLSSVSSVTSRPEYNIASVSSVSSVVR
ncbi:hypothetical protein ABZP36_033140 [Zizania latifolia]